MSEAFLQLAHLVVGDGVELAVADTVAKDEDSTWQLMIHLMAENYRHQPNWLVSKCKKDN